MELEDTLPIKTGVCMTRQIIIEPYNVNWIEQYKDAEQVIKQIFKEDIVDIEHIGSTSVEDLSSKPTIDILVIVKNISEIDNLNENMSEHGFIAEGEGGIKGRRYFYKTLTPDSVIETHHVHVYQKGNPKYQEELLFRDYLRVDKIRKKEYETLKINLAKEHKDDPRAYTNAKADFILNTVKIARILKEKGDVYE